MDSESQLPLVKVAFDDPGTRAAWEETQHRVNRRLWLWSGLFVVALAVGFVLTGLVGAVGPAIVVVAVLVFLCAVYACRGALSRLRRARSVLETYPWQRLTAVRRIAGDKEATGVVVQFRIPDGGDGEWSQTFSARNPLRWNRWEGALERGAWFAGDVRLGGVVALPGGRGLMTVQRRTQVLVSERLTAKADHDSLLAAAAARRG